MAIRKKISVERNQERATGVFELHGASAALTTIERHFRTKKNVSNSTSKGLTLMISLSLLKLAGNC